MKYLQTKHEKDAARMTALVTLIIVLLLFFASSPPYTDPPEEYGVAINFGSPSQVEDNFPQELPSSPQDSNDSDVAENSEPEEVVEEVVEETVEEAVKEQAEQDLLTQEAEAAIKIKEAEKLAKEKAEEVAKEAKAKQEAKQKAEAEMQARAKAFKAKADKSAKEKADALAKAAAAKKAAEGGSGTKNSKFNAQESVPIYPGCENGNNASKEKCLSRKLKQFIADNFNKEIAGDVGLSGIQSIKIRFNVDKSGKIVGVRALAKHPKLVDEAKRVIALLPRLKPAIQNGKPANYPYSLPIAIQTGK